MKMEKMSFVVTSGGTKQRIKKGHELSASKVRMQKVSNAPGFLRESRDIPRSREHFEEQLSSRMRVGALKAET